MDNIQFVFGKATDRYGTRDIETAHTMDYHLYNHQIATRLPELAGASETTIIVEGHLYKEDLPLAFHSCQHRIALVHTLAHQVDIDEWRDEYEFYKQFDGFIFVTKHLASDFQHAFDLEKRFIVAPPGCDHIEASKKNNKPQGHWNFLCVGALNRQHNQRFLVDVLARMALTNISWSARIVGNTATDPEYSASVIRALEARNLCEKVTLLEGAEALSASYRWATILLVPSLYEPYSYAATAALLKDLTVITSEPGGLQDFLEDGKTAIHCFSDVNMFTDAIFQAIGDPSCLQKLSQGRRAIRFPTWNETVLTIVDFLAKGSDDECKAHGRATDGTSAIAVQQSHAAGAH